MLARKLPWALLAAAAALAGFGVDRYLAAAAEGKQDLKPAVNLPMTRVVLFNSGVGYFARSAEIDGDARVDLAFPDADVNDLLKSMTLEDFGGGRIAAVSYDSREPISRTLSSFAINLDGNPTFAGILHQARGERVEVTLQPSAANQPGKLAGAIVGIERQVKDQTTTEILNLWCAEGLRAVKLADVQQLRFANPVIETEFRRALEVLALNHDSQKKTVSLHFAGDGKRKVQVGYVVEAPIWKTSYRLVLDGPGKAKPYLQGWAIVENPTDEDWTGVKMGLVSGRPISFKMDLYNPLFAPRSTVEPELFASLRPPTYTGGYANKNDARVPVELNSAPKELNKVSLPAVPPPDLSDTFLVSGVYNFSPKFANDAQRKAAIVKLVGECRDLMRKGDYEAAQRAADQAYKLCQTEEPSLGAMKEMVKMTRRVKDAEKLSDAKERMVLAGLNGAEQDGPQIGQEWRRYWFNDQPGHLTPERIHGGIIGDSVATGAALGDFFQYTIDHHVSLARQKSAMLPIVGKDVEGSRVSIYNPTVQPKHPLLGLRFKNTSGLHLAQGPITVFEGNTYAGDTRVLDVQPNEERLISYAIDLGTEVDPQVGAGSAKLIQVKAVKGVVVTTEKFRDVLNYRIKNRSQQDRTLVIEHPNRTNQQYKLVETDKPIEDTKNVYRFQIAVKAGEEKTFTVTEEHDSATNYQMSFEADAQMKYFLSVPEASASLKAKLREAIKLRSAWDAQSTELAQLIADLNRLSADQERIRKNLANTPKEAEVYTVYLKKLSDQEKEIDGLTAKHKQRMAAEFAAKKAFEDYLANLTE